MSNNTDNEHRYDYDILHDGMSAPWRDPSTSVVVRSRQAETFRTATAPATATSTSRDRPLSSLASECKPVVARAPADRANR